MKYKKLYIVLSECIGDIANVNSVFVRKEDAERQLKTLPTDDFYNYIQEADVPVELNEDML